MNKKKGKEISVPISPKVLEALSKELTKSVTEINQ